MAACADNTDVAGPDSCAVGEPKSLERHLICQYLAGDVGAFDRLVGRSKDDAYARAYWLTGNPEDAFDVVQECYVKLLRALRRWDHSCSISTWLYRVVTNACIDLHRRRKTRLLIDDEDVAAALGHTQRESSGSPFHAVVSREDVMELRRHIEALPPRMQRCIRLRYMDGKSIAEVAAIQGCSEGTVKAAVFQGLRKLRSALGSVFSPSGVT